MKMKTLMKKKELLWESIDAIRPQQTTKRNCKKIEDEQMGDIENNDAD
jgi:hypothetical protein